MYKVHTNAGWRDQMEQQMNERMIVKKKMTDKISLILVWCCDKENFVEEIEKKGREDEKLIHDVDE